MSKDISNILENLKESALSGWMNHLETYLDNEEEILKLVVNMDGIKSELYCYEVEDAKQMAKFLPLYSDFTSIFTAPSSKKEYNIQRYHSDHPRNIIRQLTIPASLSQGNLNKNYPISPCYLCKNDSDTAQLTKSVEPFITKGSFLLRPMRILWVDLPDYLHSNAQHEIYYASSDTANTHWFAKEINEENSFVIQNGLQKFQSQTLLELTLPYFDNISIETLSKILEDESDLLGKFRVTLKQLAKKIIDSEDLEEFRNDEIRPEIEAISRKFKTITGLHRLSTGASVATYTLSLVGIQVNSNINFQTLFNTLLGSSALGLIASEIRYQTEMDKLKDNPYFLLWKISGTT